MSSDEPTVKINTIDDLIAVAPYLIGYRADRHLIIVGVDESTDRATAAVCVELPPAGADHTAVVEDMRQKLVTRRATAVYLLAFGDGPDATPLVDAVRKELSRHGLRVVDALRIADGRYWSYLNIGPGHGPPDGTPIDPIGSNAVMEAATAGYTLFPSRSAIAATIAPVQGAARTAMRKATAVARELVDGARALAPARAAIDHRTATYRFLPRAADRYRRGEIIDDTQAALLSIVLGDKQTRDVAAAHTAHGDTRAYLRLWTDLARRTEPTYRVPALTLVAFAAWRTGDGAMANIATDAALAIDPHYILAILMREFITDGTDPLTITIPQPGQLADG